VTARLFDSFGRGVSYLRISVTDVCNLRCVYCMPESQTRFAPTADLLTREEIVRLCRLLVGEGVRKIRLTGGEPLARPDIVEIAADLAALGLPGGLALSTNGVLFSRCAIALRAAGVDRVNISLDVVDAEHFRKMTHRDRFEDVLSAVDLALSMGFPKVKVNAVIVRGWNDDQLLPLARIARRHPVSVRFMEYMPYGENPWKPEDHVPVAEMRVRIEAEHRLRELPRGPDAGPAREYSVEGFVGSIGFISPISNQFCAGCNRIRLTSQGRLQACLFGSEGADLREPMRSGAADDAILAAVRRAVWRKEERHPLFPGMSPAALALPTRNMNTIGG
jgi:molybdenum cofactor biosynthesis protein A